MFSFLERNLKSPTLLQVEHTECGVVALRWYSVITRSGFQLSRMPAESARRKRALNLLNLPVTKGWNPML